MTIQQVVPFTNAANYTYDTALIEIIDGKAYLKLSGNTGQTFTEAYGSASGFTFSDAGKIEVNGGQLQQIDQTVANSLVAAKYASAANLNWSKNGSVTGNTFGTTSVTGGKFVANGGDNSGVYYENAAIASATSTGTIKLKYTPNYTTTPGVNTNIVSLTPSSGNANRIIFFNSPSGNNLRVTAYNSAGISVVSAGTFGGFSPTSGVEYELEFTWNTTTGTFRCYVNGVALTPVVAGLYTRTGTANRLYVGADRSTYQISNGSFDDVLLFSDVQHILGYTPGYTVQDFIYAEAYADLPAFSYSGLGTLQALTNLANTEGGTVRYVIDGTYWNGSAVVASDKSVSQSNTLAEINTNIASFAATDTPQITGVFPGQNTQGTSDDTILTYTGQFYSTENPMIKLMSTVLTSGITDFAATLSASGSDAVKFTVEKDGVEYWWDTSAWSTSSGYAQSNTAADINTNISSFDLSSGSNVRFVIYLHSDDGSTTPNMDEHSFNYNFYNPEEELPDKCVITGYVLDSAGNKLASCAITITPQVGGFISGKNFYMPKAKTNITSDSNGFFQVQLIRSSEFDTAILYDFKFVPSGSLIKSEVLNATVPDQAALDFGSITVS